MNCKWRYADLIKRLEFEYSTCWEEKIFDLNKISILANWKPAFSLLKRTLEYEDIKYFLSQYLLRAFNKILENICENIDFQ